MRNPLSLEDVARLLAEAGQGSEEVLGALACEPVLLVDLDRGGPTDLRVPAHLPAVVVGISRSGEAAPGGDIALTTHRGDRSCGGWVVCDDLDADVDRLVTRITRFPTAAVTLARVLRINDGLSEPVALEVESLAYSTLQGGAEFAEWHSARVPASHVESPAPVIVDRRADVLAITLNRPEVHNAYDTAMRDSLYEALALAASDSTIEHVELRGRGLSFSSGGDIAEFGTLADPANANIVRTSRSPARLLASISDRVTAYIHGSCIGSGIELPAFAHTVVADPDTIIQLPELEMGLIPGAGGTVSVTRRIGATRTAWLVLAGQRIGAATAEEWGLVDVIGDVAPGGLT